MATAVFSKCADILNTALLTSSSFRIWSSSTGIPSPPLALFIIILPRAHLISHLRMSGSSRMITSSWLFGSLRPFLYRSVYSYHFFLICSASAICLLFLSLIISSFLKEISSLSHTFVFLYLFALFSKGLFISPWYSLTLHSFSSVYLSLSPLPFTCLLSLTICKMPQTINLPSCISFSWNSFWSLPPVQCYKPP